MLLSSKCILLFQDFLCRQMSNIHQNNITQHSNKPDTSGQKIHFTSQEKNNCQNSRHENIHLENVNQLYIFTSQHQVLIHIKKNEHTKIGQKDQPQTSNYIIHRKPHWIWSKLQPTKTCEKITCHDAN